MANGSVRRLALRLVREPLVHFLAAGLLLFLAADYHRRAEDQYRIVVTPERVASLKTAYRAEFGAEPDADMVARLVDDYVTSEVWYREGIARGLDKDDEIVRRRIVQKAAFLEQGMNPVAEPDEANLREWYDRRRERYLQPGTVSFSHIFFAAQPGSEDKARARAEAALSRLDDATVRAPERGDPFPDLHDFSGFGANGARRLFGDTEMASALFSVPMRKWAGPFRSAFGWHLVRVSAASAARPAAFDAVRPQVLADYMEAARARADVARLKALMRRYTVVKPE